MAGIQQQIVSTKKDNTISVFYNPTNDLLVIDLIHHNEAGGCELLRCHLDEDRLLRHCEPGTSRKGSGGRLEA